ncbi:MAG: insulinase family protein [Armatimonadetes bacterium]|nr:insulinase family protein [Armatimonadota bacterium]
MRTALPTAYQPVIETTVLDNGLTVATEAMPGRRVASLSVWSPAGSAREARGEAGISHLLEHMLFKGTSRRSAFAIAAVLDAVGGDLNAFTEREHSCYHCTLLGEHMPLAVRVLTEMLFDSQIAEADLATERGVVLGEIADYDDTPDDVVHDEALRLLWRTHPLGRPIHGSAGSVVSLSREALVAYRDRWYAPGALVLSAAGDVRHDRLVGLLKDTALADARPVAAARARVPKASRGSRVFPRETEQTHLCVAVPASGWNDDLRYVDGVLAAALGSTPSSRLFHQIRERRGLAYNVGAFHMPCERAGVLTLYANTMPDKLERVLELLTREVGKLRRSAIGAAELQRVRRGIISNVIMTLDSPVSEARRLGHSLLHRDTITDPEETISKIAAVSAEDVRRRADELFADGFWAQAIAGPVEERQSGVRGSAVAGSAGTLAG